MSHMSRQSRSWLIWCIPLGIAVALGLTSWGMFELRSLCEPLVRLLHTALRVWRPALGSYDPSDYVFYAAFPAFAGALMLVVEVWALTHYRADEARLDRFLTNRLPRHEITMVAHPTTDDRRESR